MQHHLLAELLPQIRKPAAHLAEALFVGDTVAEDTRVRAAVVEPGYGAEAFLARRVPDLQADNGVRVCVQDTLGEKGGTDCGGGVGEGPEGAVDVAVDEGGFADALGAEDYDFGF